MGGKYISKKEKQQTAYLLMFLLGSYLLESTRELRYLRSSVYLYKIKPTIFIIIVIMAVKYGLKLRINKKMKYQRLATYIGLINAVLYLMVFIFAGFFTGFGQSPYDTSFHGICTNIYRIVGIGIGMEYIRSFLVNNTFNKNYVISIVSTSILFTLIECSNIELRNIQNGLELVTYLGEQIFPNLGIHIVASYLTYLGGVYPSLIFMVIIKLFYNICPILPDLSWILKTFLGTIIPFVNMSLIQFLYEDEVRTVKIRDKNEEGVFGWIITSVASILIIWFASGLFSIYPSVIATGSMEPLIYPGDMIILEKVQEIKSLNEGDIVQFKRDNILITHRIMSIVINEKTKELEFITKGDNNSCRDFNTVKEQQIKGKLLKTIPKIGLFTLLMKADKDVNLNNIEF